MFQRTVVGWVILSCKNLSSFNFYSILEENCVADINNETFECNIFADNCCKNRFWVSYTFLQKPLLFKQYWISSSFSRNIFLFENQRFWRNQYSKVLMASKCDENKNWLSKTQKKSKCKFGKSFCQNASKKKGLKLFFFNFFPHFPLFIQGRMVKIYSV